MSHCLRGGGPIVSVPGVNPKLQPPAAGDLPFRQLQAVVTDCKKLAKREIEFRQEAGGNGRSSFASFLQSVTTERGVESRSDR